MKEFRNQILVTDRIFITPEFKRKKKVYKWNFIVSVFLVCCLFSYYIYAEYDKNKSEEVSKTLLAETDFEGQEEPAEISTTIKTKDNVIIVMLDPNDTQTDSAEEVNVDEVEVASGNMDTATYTANDGTDYRTVAKIDIPKIDVHYPVIAPLNKDLKDYTAILKISPCRYYGPEPNEVGNFCIVGHNYRNEKFFSKVPTLENGDIVELTDTKKRTIQYKVYSKYIVNPDQNECTDQATNGKKEITLITCTNDSKQRYIIKCVEI